MSNKFKQLLKWRVKATPEIDIDSKLYEALKPFRLPIVLLLIITLVGTLGYIIIDNMSLLDAIYQTGITFTTVGFGEIAPISPLGRIFTITLIILGFAVFTFAMGILIEVINKGNFIDILKERNMLYKIARLQNHFVICYHNQYTIEVSKEFRKAQVPFVVIDNSDNFNKEAIKYKYPYYVKSKPYIDSALRMAHISSAKGIVLLSENIAENIAQISTIRLFEKELNRDPYLIIAAVKNQEDIQKLKKLGADSVIAPNRLMAQRISAMAFRPDMENLLEQFLYKKDTPMDMEEIAIPNNSWIVFKRIKELHLRDITQASIIGIKEKDGHFIPMPKGDNQILMGSILLVIGTSKAISFTKKLINSETKPKELRYI